MENRNRVYEGDLPYVFVSYSHKDAARVNVIIQELMARGYRVWYDSGIEVGKEWPAYIAAHLKKCGCFIAFLTENYMRSDNCRQELHYALQKDRNILPVYLEDVELSEGLDMQLSPIHALMFYNDRDRDRLVSQITNAAIMKPCFAEQPVPPVSPVPPVPPTPPVRTGGAAEWIRKNSRLLVICAALILAVVAGAMILKGCDDDPVVTPQVEVAQQTLPTEAAADPETDHGAEALAVVEDPLENTLMTNSMSLTADEKDDKEAEENEPFFGTQALRKEVATVTFLDTLTDAPADAADASMLQNGKVKAWAVKNGELYDVFIAAEGGVYAPADSGNLLRNLANATAIRFGGAFHTETAQNMRSLLSGNAALTEIDISELNTVNVQDMAGMFAYCASLTELDLSNFITDNVTEMFSMFFGCENLTDLNISSFDTKNVTSFYAMFSMCRNLKRLNLSHFKTGKAEHMNWMFSNCDKLEELILKDFNTINVKQMDAMFLNCKSLVELDLSDFRTGNVTDMNRMFYQCESLERLNLNNVTTASVSDMSSMFNGCKSLKELDVSGFQTGNVKDMNCMFYQCGSLTELVVSEFDTSRVENMAWMFADCSSMQKMDVSKFDTSSAKNVYCMFYNCGCAETLDVSNFDMSSVDTSDPKNYDFFMNKDVKPSGMDWKQLFA